MELKKIDDTRMIKQSNRLVEARYNLTKYEQRMMIAICSQLDPNEDDFERVRVGVADMADFCNMKGKNPYVTVRNTIMRLAGRTLQIKTSDGGWVVSHWLQSARYYPSDGVIEYKVDHDLKPELLQLKAAYLSTQAAPIMEFRRDYSARLYFLLKKMLKVREFEYELEFFRDRFQLGKTYQRISNLKDRVLEPALAEINAKSDITVDHEYIKRGRTYTKIKFTVALKGKTDKKDLPAPEALEPHTEPSEPIEKALEDLGQTRLFATAMPSAQSASSEAEKKKRQLFFDNEILFSKLSRYLLNEKIEDLIIKYGAERVESNLDYAEHNKEGKRNMAGWIVSCIDCDHAAAERAIVSLNKQEAERERAELMARLEPMPKIELDPNDKRTVRERFADLKNDLKKRKG